MSQPLLVLASASPRRRELLTQIGVRFHVHAVEAEEIPRPDETPPQYVQRVAAEKSALAQAAFGLEVPVLGADTEVVLDGKVFGKPADCAAAHAMLARLSGREHEVFSAVSLRRGNAHWQAISRSVVRFRSISAAEITAYWASGEPQGKAGAYAIQGLGAVFVEHLSGSFSGVMGLPLFETAAVLREAGLGAAWLDTPA